MRNEYREKNCTKRNNHIINTIFMWFGNLLISTKLLRFYYVMKKIQEQSYNTFFLIQK